MKTHFARSGFFPFHALAAAGLIGWTAEIQQVLGHDDSSAEGQARANQSSTAAPNSGTDASVLESATLRAAAVAPAKPEFTEVQYLSGGEILLRLKAPSDVNARVEVSANLVDWAPLATLPKSAATLEYTDSGTPAFASRYYRAQTVLDTNPVTGDHLATSESDVVFHPINHATFIMTWKGKAIYSDPVGGTARFQGLPRPDLVLITDIHADHMDVSTLAGVGAKNAQIIAPQAVFQQLSADLKAVTKVLANGETTEALGISIEAIPMYNLTSSRLGYHTKGRGNGYVLNIGGKRIYISGDTEDIPEMRALKGIDIAFLCMNLPYTMDINQAANAARDFQPKVVYPFHSSGSDVNKFKQSIGTGPGIEVRLRKWY